MGLKLSLLARMLLIAVFALLTGPRPAMAEGERVVICGMDGSKRTVVFDFETGAPVAATGFHTCDHCNAPTGFLPPAPQYLTAQRIVAFTPPALPDAPVRSRMPSAAPSVRAPPVSV